jgi:hypothetical protein
MPFYVVFSIAYQVPVAISAVYHFPIRFGRSTSDDCDVKRSHRDFTSLVVWFYLLTFWLAILVAGVPWYIFAFVAVRLRDYMVLYQSYDDNTIMDRLERLAAAIRMVPIDAMRDTFIGLCRLQWIKLDRVALTEAIEV